MRAGDSVRVNALRLIKSELTRLEQEKREELSDSLFWQLLNRMRKQRRESIEQYEKAKRSDLADKEQFELKVIESFLPPQLEESELLTLIENTIKETGAVQMKDIGKVMAKLKTPLEGRADMKHVSEIIRNRLGQS